MLGDRARQLFAADRLARRLRCPARERGPVGAAGLDGLCDPRREIAVALADEQISEHRFFERDDAREIPLQPRALIDIRFNHPSASSISSCYNPLGGTAT